MSEQEISTEETAAVRILTKLQRRVLGVLVEKAFTVPESYPLTLKSVMTGCNQKSNRDPVTNYSEDQCLEALDQLRELGLVVVVHTESGRTERYRHFVRKRYPFSEAQLAIITELLLRGRQQPGELRSRASRMVPIENLNDLRTELDGLLAAKYVQASGPLDRRGVEVDHTFYPDDEQRTGFAPMSDSGADLSAPAAAKETTTPTAPQVSWLQNELASLKTAHTELQAEFYQIQQSLEELRDDLAELRKSLGA